MRCDRHFTAVILGLCAFIALAGCGRAPATTIVLADDMFVSRDQNGDGRLTLDESGLGALMFTSMDRNRDQALTPLEWQGGRENPDNAYQTQIQNEEQRRPNTAPPPVY